jgi:tRNA-specific 2-thiouridylase
MRLNAFLMPSNPFAQQKKGKVLVGMSGGVDSSVAAALLVEQGYDVTGGFIKNWSDTKDLWTGECEWRGERRDALRVAARLKIPLLTFDFETEYRKRVLDRMFDEYREGITPNPDVLCNEEIKFGLFFEAAKKLGFDYIATGHYARVQHEENGSHLLIAIDPAKDQSYFLKSGKPMALPFAVTPIKIFQEFR